MTIISLIVGIISLALCWLPVYGLIISILCVAGTALLKRRHEYGKKRRLVKVVALMLAITSAVIAIFVTGANISNTTENVIIDQTNEGTVDNVSSSFSYVNLEQVQQQAIQVWNEEV